jgi:hypothetical protein
MITAIDRSVDEGVLMPVPLSMLVWKALLDEPTSIDDLREVSDCLV